MSTNYPAEYTSFSGADYKAYVDGKLCGALASMNTQIQHKGRLFKKRYPITIYATTTIFGMQDVIDSITNKKDSTIKIDLENEYGSHAAIEISGVRLISKGINASVDDITIEAQYLFKAKKVEYIYK
jgi:hypothetical protein